MVLFSNPSAANTACNARKYMYEIGFQSCNLRCKLVEHVSMETLTLSKKAVFENPNSTDP